MSRGIKIILAFLAAALMVGGALFILQSSRTSSPSPDQHAIEIDDSQSETDNVSNATVPEAPVQSPTETTNENIAPAPSAVNDSSVLDRIPTRDVPYAEDFYIADERGRYVNDALVNERTRQFLAILYSMDDSQARLDQLAEFVDLSYGDEQLSAIVSGQSDLPQRFSAPEVAWTQLQNGFVPFPDTLISVRAAVGEQGGQPSASCTVVYNASLNVVSVLFE